MKIQAASNKIKLAMSFNEWFSMGSSQKWIKSAYSSVANKELKVKVSVDPNDDNINQTFYDDFELGQRMNPRETQFIHDILLNKALNNSGMLILSVMADGRLEDDTTMVPYGDRQEPMGGKSWLVDNRPSIQSATFEYVDILSRAKQVIGLSIDFCKEANNILGNYLENIDYDFGEF